MDKRNELIAELIGILKGVKACDIEDPDENLFGRRYDYTSGEMLDVCMELKRRYHINLNSFIHNIEAYTVNNIADALCKAMTVNV
jgi:acyl carrier protein